MNEQEILDNAPDGATSYSAKQKQYWDWPKRTVKPFDSGNLDIDYPDDLRSLADIARIAELEKVNATLHKLMTSGESRGVAKATEEFKERIVDIEKTIKSLTDGVTHFHKSHGDMNPLLTAYIEALKEQGQ